MSFVRTLVLLAVAAGLGAWLWLVEAPRLEEEAKATFLLDVDIPSVEKVRFKYPDGTNLEVVRESGDSWKLTEPLEYAADGKVIENFLTTVKETKIERRLDKEETGALATYGLEGETGSQARLEITQGGTALPAVVLGGTTPVGHQAFARREGSEEVLVIPLLLQSSARKQPLDLRAKTMFDGDTAGVTRVTIEKPGEKIDLERRGESAWAMLSPVADAGDNESVRSMLDSIATIDATAFYDGPAVDRQAFGLDESATRFTATREDGSSIAFAIGKESTDAPAGNYFERASDKQVIKAPDWVATKFSPPANELRNKRLLSCTLDEIRSMTWTIAGETFTIAREAVGKPWTISPEIAGQVLNQRIVDNAVNSLVLARADAVVGDAAGDADLAQWGLDAPSATLKVQGANGPCADLAGAPVPVQPEAPDAQASRPPAPSFYLKNAGRSAVMRASEHEYSRIAMKRPAFVEAAPPAGAEEAPDPAE
ncbi:MAG: DUF4340 domain-containing protein [Candidatus Binatia bacterium]